MEPRPASLKQATPPASTKPRRRARRARRGLSRIAAEAIQRQLLGDRTCWGRDADPMNPDQDLVRHAPATIHSAAWADAMLSVEYAEDGQERPTYAYEPSKGPPEADSPSCRLITCRHCGVPTPTPCSDRETAGCLDCHVSGNGLPQAAVEARQADQEAWGPSPWREAMDAARRFNHRLL